MADPGKKASAENPFPVIPGVPSRSELMKPLIFPNSQRGFKIFTWVATAGAVLYCIFIPDYPGEHVFMPIRRWVHEQKGKLLRIRPEDEEYVKQRTAELAAKQTVNEAVKKTIQS